ncbi:Protein DETOXIFICATION 45, chloroplastic [Porphyridium purpureum]|uniref:Protein DETOXIFICATION 45, chloroplastic n=1 Tax=Porphyridium purpureum TaxID=35688 RepID=A0A5J4YI12_PORPP|nr:Protein DETOXIFICATION 45, chloroplastic [Porphyridium purpureum]|eukprot:POR2545..scf218_34
MAAFNCGWIPCRLNSSVGDNVSPLHMRIHVAGAQERSVIRGYVTETAHCHGWIRSGPRCARKPTLGRLMALRHRVRQVTRYSCSSMDMDADGNAADVIAAGADELSTTDRTPSPSPLATTKERSDYDAALDAVPPRHEQEREFRKALIGLAVPAMGAVLVDPFLSIVDTMYVARLGTLQLASLGPCTSLFNFIFSAWMPLFTISTSVAVSSCFKCDMASNPEDSDGVPADGLLCSPDARKAAQIVLFAGTLAVCVGLALLLVAWQFAEPLLRAVNASDALMPHALGYLRARLLALPFLFVLLVCDGAHRGVSDTRTPLVMSTLCGAINCVLDPLLMFQFGWGVPGAAAATSAAQIIVALAFAQRVLAQPQRFDIRGAIHARMPFPARADRMAFFRASSALLVRQLTNVSVWTLMSAFASRMGVLHTAAHQVVITAFVFCGYLHDGVAVAGQILTSRYLQLRPTRVALRVARRFVSTAARLSLVSSLGIALAAQASLHLWVPALASDTAVRAMATRTLRALLLLYPVFTQVWLRDALSFGAQDYAFNARALVAATLMVVPVFALITAARPSTVGLAMGFGAGFEPSVTALWAALALAYFLPRLLMHLHRLYMSRTGPFATATGWRALHVHVWMTQLDAMYIGPKKQREKTMSEEKDDRARLDFAT